MNKVFINDGNKEVGDYSWYQLSMWEFSPKKCVELFVRSSCGKHVYHYVLKRMYERVTPAHTKWVVVECLDSIPEDVLSWRNGQVKVKR